MLDAQGGKAMESVTVLLYFVLALVAAPVAWFVWFGLDEIFRPARTRSAH
jgi:hypothetical protein